MDDNFETTLKGLERLAFSGINDAVRLILKGEKLTQKQIQALDLFSVSSIDKNGSGGVKINFYNRQDALEALLTVAKSKNATSGMDSLMKALTASKNSAGEQRDI